ncbi:hypothetical protein M231_05996 [Tremella mesenterica]|uniref:Uncharacterized protein n=2 Tax=Tremella mesenterica TaxID=5217 RepID=A0A4Q1BGR0_TREME|nr:hypothetical protein M231_05996 [Tremella mesenterica]
MAWRGVKQHCTTDFRARYFSLLPTVPSPTTVLPFDSVYHMIFLPNHSEHISTLRETLWLLSTHPSAQMSYHPVLAMEGREAGSVAKALELLAEFKSSFRDIGYTVHPAGLEGQAAGKSSNLAWAIRAAWGEMNMVNPSIVDKTVVTVFDSDTALAADYFADVSCRFALRSPEERKRMTFCPPIVFDRNAHQVPIGVRNVDSMWVLAGLSSIFPGSGAKIPTSAYSLSMSLCANVGFHDAGPEAIGEDMHMFIKCLFSTAGNLISETIYSPASHLDVISSEPHGLKGYWNNHVARYTQSMRHMFGSLDCGYFVTRLLTGDFTPTGPEFQDDIPSSTHTIFTSHLDSSIPDQVGLELKPSLRPPPYSISSLAQPIPIIAAQVKDMSLADISMNDASLSSVDSELEADEKVNLIKSDGYFSPPPLKLTSFVSLMGRLYEAHLLMIHMVIFLLTRSFAHLPGEPSNPPGLVPSLVIFQDDVLLVNWAIGVADKLRSLLLPMTLVLLLLLDRYHQQCVLHRWTTPGASERLGQQSSSRSYRKFPLSLLDFFGFPAGIIFGVIPLLHAQTLHLFTNRLTYKVSFKPQSKEERPDEEKALKDCT